MTAIFALLLLAPLPDASPCRAVGVEALAAVVAVHPAEAAIRPADDRPGCGGRCWAAPDAESSEEDSEGEPFPDLIGFEPTRADLASAGRALTGRLRPLRDAFPPSIRSPLLRC